MSTNKFASNDNCMNDQLYRIYKNVFNMLYNRGYERIEPMPFEKFEKLTKDKIQIIANLRPDYTLGRWPRIIVFFHEGSEKLGVKLVKNYKDKMLSLGIDKAILIVKENVTSFAKSEINSFMTQDPPIYIEVFLESSLIFDITTHELVPKHELISDSEKKALFEKYKIKEMQLAKILKTDPIVLYYDFQEKDIIKITRSSETGGIYTNYRIVV
jgi:DNA-directed RNA polymerase I, II, and III subunit RPABC1